ncbi:MAG: hypothetical protein JOY64_31100 [Alphaproteobacteria bacterium]|nr:hypothetical protein [Alphaproteobacteria bacterium]MBV8412110.1 hypothetical protein [Alphaproteobacteria bacterium]
MLHVARKIERRAQGLPRLEHRRCGDAGIAKRLIERLAHDEFDTDLAGKGLIGSEARILLVVAKELLLGHGRFIEGVIVSGDAKRCLADHH